MWEIGFFFLTLSKITLKYLKHPLWKIWEAWWIPIPFHQPTLSKQLHYIKFMWWEDKNLLTFCWPYRHRNLGRHYKSHISSDFYIQNLMLQSPKPNVKSSWWVKPWHQFRFPAFWLCLWEAPAWGEALTSSLPTWRGCAAILAPPPPARLSRAPHTGASTLVRSPGVCHCPGDNSRRLVLAASVPAPTGPCLCVCRRAAAWSWVSCQPPSGAHGDPRRPHQDADKSGHSLTHWEPKK